VHTWKRLFLRRNEAAALSVLIAAELGLNPDTADSPSLHRCQPSCANIARTDQHAQQLRQRAAVLERQADSEAVPGPLAERLYRSSARLRSQADAHSRDRVTGGESTS
jgi:hypothetical protein